MVPGYNESLHDKMGKASLKGLVPGFDQEVEWERLSQKLHPPGGSVQIRRQWFYAAAVTALFLCGSLAWLIRQPNKTNVPGQQVAVSDKDKMHEWIKSVVVPPDTITVQDSNPIKKEVLMRPPVTIKYKPGKDEIERKAGGLISQSKPSTPPPAKGHYNKHRIDELFDYYRTKEFICNGTPCPLQICILQTIQCKNDAPSAVATCSTIEPDQAGQLKYKVNTAQTHDCNVTIDEIRITRVNTGETIVLNASSKPSTAQDLFDYITGQKEGDLLTGIFHTDCNKNTDNEKLTIDNNYGSYIIK